MKKLRTGSYALFTKKLRSGSYALGTFPHLRSDCTGVACADIVKKNKKKTDKDMDLK